MSARMNLRARGPTKRGMQPSATVLRTPVGVSKSGKARREMQAKAKQQQKQPGQVNEAVPMNIPAKRRSRYAMSLLPQLPAQARTSGGGAARASGTGGSAGNRAVDGADALRDGLAGPGGRNGGERDVSMGVDGARAAGDIGPSSGGAATGAAGTGGAAAGGRGGGVDELMAVDVGMQNTFVSDDVIRLMEQRRELSAVKEKLEESKKLFRAKSTQKEASFRQVDEKSQKFRRELLEFNKFLVENDHKWSIMNRRAKAEKDARKFKEKTLESLQNELEHCQKAQLALQAQLRRHVSHQQFLNRVVDACDDMSEIDDIIQRHRTLQASLQQLETRVSELQHDVDVVPRRIQALNDYMTSVVLNKNQKLAELKAELESLQTQVVRKEAAIVDKQVSMSDEMKELSMIQMACENLIGRVPSRRVDRAAFLHLSRHQKSMLQLKVIGDHMKDMIDIVASYSASSEAAFVREEILAGVGLQQGGDPLLSEPGAPGVVRPSPGGKAPVVPTIRHPHDD